MSELLVCICVCLGTVGPLRLELAGVLGSAWGVTSVQTEVYPQSGDQRGGDLVNVPQEPCVCSDPTEH